MAESAYMLVGSILHATDHVCESFFLRMTFNLAPHDEPVANQRYIGSDCCDCSSGTCSSPEAFSRDDHRQVCKA